MISIQNWDTYGWEASVRGLRNPLNSWDRSDSTWDGLAGERYGFIIGRKDMALMKKLVKAGTDHSKFMRMINVTADITAPLYWWKEFDTYKVGVTTNSCSTMHKIHEKEFVLEDFSTEHLDDFSVDHLETLILYLNSMREMFLETGNNHYWWQMIQLLPSSYNQKRTVQMNYQVLRNIYHARKNHKLNEWRDLCKWIEEKLPYAELITEE